MITVAMGGAIGAAFRYIISEQISQRKSVLPMGTIAVNVLGSLIIGILAGIVATDTWRLLLVTGFCGGFTTFSTATVDTLRLAKTGNWRAALINTVANLTLSLTAVFIGISIGMASGVSL